MHARASERMYQRLIGGNRCIYIYTVKGWSMGLEGRGADDDGAAGNFGTAVAALPMVTVQHATYSWRVRCR